MDRRRTVTTAAGLSAVLVAGGAAVASANGIFGAGRAEKVGSFSAMRGRLVPVDSLLPSPSTSTSVLAPTTTEREVAPTTATPESEPSDDTPAPTAAPVVSPASSTTVSHSGPSPVSGEHESDDRSDSSGVESDD